MSDIGPGGYRLPRRLALLIFPICAAASCGGGGGAEQWDPGVVRAVARQVDAELSGERVVVLQYIGGPDGAELPWAARQSLATAGIEVGDTTALRDPAVAVLVFEQSRGNANEWQVSTRLMRSGAALSGDVAPPRRWLVRCRDQQCTAQPAADAEPVTYSLPTRPERQA
jgi:hypothetical protein